MQYMIPGNVSVVVDSPIDAWTNNILIGTSSWSERSLTHESDWYPKRSMQAKDRMAFYAQRFPIVEMETTYRFPPTPEMAKQWADRTPDGFTIDVQAWSLLTEQPTVHESLWPDLANAVPETKRDNRRLYSSHLPSEVMDEAWLRFRHAIQPLHDAGRLGTIILRYPHWFSPGDRTRDELAMVRARLGDLPAAIEFSAPKWVDAEMCEQTFSLLEDLDLSFVCVDAPLDDPRRLNGSNATTTDIAVVKLLGRRPLTEDDRWAQDRRGYRYDKSELLDLIPRLKHLATSAKSVHVLFATCWRDDAVRNGEMLKELLVAAGVD